MDIIAQLQCLEQVLDKTTLRRLGRIAGALLAMTGRVTMLGISRWTGPGGSYRTVQRFFNTVIPWCQLQWLLLRDHVLGNDEDDIWLVVGDETVVTKAGKETYGLDRFFSSIYGRPVPGLSFFSFSLVSVKRRRSYPMLLEQYVKPDEPHAPSRTGRKPKQPATPKTKRKRGRPKGSKNKNRREVELSAQLLHVQGMLRKLLALVGVSIPLTYCVLDGAFGNNAAVQMVRQCGLHLISKLRHDAALYFPYAGPYGGRGPHKKYGAKLDYAHLPQEHLQETTIEDNIRTDIYQMPMWHKLFADKLNVVVVVQTNLKSGARAHVVLFSNDLGLAYDKLIDYYRLRFQIEFNFRDAKQYWGLEDFMNVKRTPVHNAANLAMFMVNVAQVLLLHFRQHNPYFSVNDLKAHYRGRKYVTETLKFLPQKPEPIIIDQIFASIAVMGSVNAQFSSA
ncbi:MAG: transposase [Acidobacteria bacterium]|nr:transposase [Acidobacteriota bacterium]